MQQRETVEEYLKRGGTIERNPQVLNTITSIWSIAGERSTAKGASPYVDPENNELKVVSWKSMQKDEKWDEDGEEFRKEDEAYWKKLNKKLDRMIKKMKI
jgi:hypothetical protein